MARAIIGDSGVIIEDGVDTFILSSGVFAENQLAVAVAAVEAGPILQFDPKWHTRYTIG